MTNSKLHMCFQLTPRSMTLNCYRFEFCFFSVLTAHVTVCICHTELNS